MTTPVSRPIALTTSAGLAMRLDPLEARVLMYAAYPFAGVGASFDDSGAVFSYTLGELAADGTVTGETTRGTLTGSPSTGPIDWASLLRASGGNLSATTVDGADGYSSQLGGMFGFSDGYQPGFLSGVREGGAVESTFLIERSDSDSAYVSMWQMTFRMLRQTADGISIVPGALYLSPGRSTVRWVVGSTDLAQGVNKTVQSISNDGVIRLVSGEVIIIEPGASGTVDSITGEVVYNGNLTCLIADLNASDGDVGVGIGGAYDQYGLINQSAPLGAVYRGSFLTNGSVASTIFGATLAGSGVSTAQVVLDLAQAGTYSIYNAAAYDAGDRIAISSGTWEEVPSDWQGDATRRLNTLRLQDGASGTVLIFDITTDLEIRGAEAFAEGSQTPERFTGLATSFAGARHASQPATTTLTIGANGELFVHQLDHLSVDFYGGDYGWYHTELTTLSGAKPVRLASLGRSYVNYYDQNAITQIIAVTTDGDVIVFENRFRSRWTVRNLTTELAGDKITGNATTIDLSAGRPSYYYSTVGVAAAGYNAAGDLVIYRTKLDDPNTQPPPNPHAVLYYSYHNITQQDLAPNGEATPAFAGTMVGYGTYWNGTNIAGLNDAGEIVVVWTAPLAARWYVNNLSQIAGTPTLTGPITAFQATWNALQIGGLDADGHVVSTWWAPGMGGAWEHSDITAEFSLTPLDTTSTAGLITFTGQTSNINIAGYDPAGNLIVYWFTPYNNDAWQQSNITSGVAAEDRPVTLLGGDTFTIYNGTYYDTGYRQTVYGVNSDGDLVNLHWTSNEADQWNLENISAVELPMPVM